MLEYKALQSRTDLLSEFQPMLRQAGLGYIAGILSIINPRLDIIRVHQSIDYGPVDRKTDNTVVYIPEKISQQKLLELTAKIHFNNHQNIALPNICYIENMPILYWYIFLYPHY